MITVAVLTISDKGSKGERDDLSGPIIQEILNTINAEVKHSAILPDDKNLIRDSLLKYCSTVDLILTTGGTGLSPRDNTPDATLEVIDRLVPGFAEAMRAGGLKKTSRAMLSRGVAGIKGETLIVNLPGSPNAVRENLTVILDVIPHAIEKIKGDSSDCAS